MKANPLAAQFKRSLAGVFVRSRTESADPVAVPQLSDYPLGPKATTQSDAWQILREHRANLVTAIAAGVFVSRIR